LIAAGILPGHRAVDADHQAHQDIPNIEIPIAARVEGIEERLARRACLQRGGDLGPIEGQQESGDDEEIKDLAEDPLQAVHDDDRDQASGKSHKESD